MSERTRATAADRRDLLKGAAWAAPVLIVGAATPATAASKTGNLAMIFDGGGGANGYLNSMYLDLGSSTSQTVTSTQQIVLTIDVIGLNTNTTSQRSFTPSSSYGTISARTYNTATRTTTFTWTLPAGTVFPPVGLGTNVPDILFSFGDGLSGFQRITNKVVVRSITGGTIVSPSTTPIDSSVVKDYNKSAASPDGIY